MSGNRNIKEEILALVREYYRTEFRPGEETPFVPGESRVNYAGRVFDDEEMTNLVDSALEFWLTAGKYTERFERGLEEFLGIRHALFVNSGSSANLLAFASLFSPLLGKRALKRGDEVITVAAGFPTTVAPILQLGCVPVFIDIERETAAPDCSLLERALSPKTKAFMAAHTLGNPFDLRTVRDFCSKHGLWLIEDNCDAFGSTFEGRFTGTWGDIGTSSFYPPHHLTTGEGGAVYTGSDLLHRILLSMRDWGRDCRCPTGCDNVCGKRFSQRFGTLPAGYDHKYVYSHFGFNLKATDLQAAIGCAQLKKFPAFAAKRRENFAALEQALSGIDWLSTMKKHPQSDPVWFGFLMTLGTNAPGSRADFARHLEKKRIQTRNLFAGNLLRHPCFTPLTEGRDYRVVSALVNTDALMNGSLWIGVYPGMTEAKLDYMAETIRAFRPRT